jgi:hypothetical protein
MDNHQQFLRLLGRGVASAATLACVATINGCSTERPEASASQDANSVPAVSLEAVPSTPAAGGAATAQQVCAQLSQIMSVMLCVAGAVPGGEEEQAISQAIIAALEEELGEDAIGSGITGISQLCSASSDFTNWSGLLTALGSESFWEALGEAFANNETLSSLGSVAICAALTASGVGTVVGLVCDATVLLRTALCMGVANYTYLNTLLGMSGVCYVDSSGNAHSCSSSQICVANPNNTDNAGGYGGRCVDASGAGNAGQPCLPGGVCIQQPNQNVQCMPPSVQSDVANAGACENCGGEGQRACSSGTGYTGTMLCGDGLVVIDQCGPPPYYCGNYQLCCDSGNGGQCDGSGDGLSPVGGACEIPETGGSGSCTLLTNGTCACENSSEPTSKPEAHATRKAHREATSSLASSSRNTPSDQ